MSQGLWLDQGCLRALVRRGNGFPTPFLVHVLNEIGPKVDKKHPGHLRPVTLNPVARVVLSQGCLRALFEEQSISP